MDEFFVEKLRKIIPSDKILVNELMCRHTTFRIGGAADFYVQPDEQQLAALLALAKQEQIPLFVIGNGSNLLVSDKGVRGIVVEIGKSMDDIKIEGNQMNIGAGTLLTKAANAAADAGLSGMEFAAGIPGSVGGAVVMNAGAYGGEMKDILLSVEVITPEGRKRTLTREQLGLSYRHSLIMDTGDLVTRAVVSLEKKNPTSIRALMADLRSRRMEKQPLEYPSAGSTFKRPEGYFAGKLIQDAGLRGYSVGGAQVSEKHCGFVINRGNATAEDVKKLIRDVQNRVYECFQVRLESEVRMLGE